MQYHVFIRDILEQATTIARGYFGNVQKSFKPTDKSQVLTQADIDIGSYIISQIEKEIPEHNIIDEERGVIAKNSTFTWVIDPIDGTSNFAQTIPLYGIMVGLLKNDIPIAGGIAMPFFRDIYIAEKSKGAFCNGKKIHAISEKDLSTSLVAYGIDPRPEKTAEEARFLAQLALSSLNVRISGSCFDVVMLALGRYSAFLNQKSKIWDNVAAHILIEEVGFVYTDFHGNPMDYSHPLTKAQTNYTFCAAPPQIHSQLQKIIHSPHR